MVPAANLAAENTRQNLWCETQSAVDAAHMVDRNDGSNNGRNLHHMVGSCFSRTYRPIAARKVEFSLEKLLNPQFAPDAVVVQNGLGMLPAILIKPFLVNWVRKRGACATNPLRSPRHVAQN